MKMVIIAGGAGTRLQELTKNKPKLMVEINGQTIFEIITNYLREQGINEIYFSLGYKAKEMLDELEVEEGEYRFIIETSPAGTGGWLNLVDQKEFDNTFLAMNGDIISELKFEDLIVAHATNREAIATIAIIEVENTEDYGRIKLDQNKIMSFEEKGQKGRGWINAGYYAFTPDIFEYAKGKKNISLEKDIFPVLAKEGRLFAHKIKGKWSDLGTKQRLKEAERLL